MKQETPCKNEGWRSQGDTLFESSGPRGT